MFLCLKRMCTLTKLFFSATNASNFVYCNYHFKIVQKPRSSPSNYLLIVTC